VLLAAHLRVLSLATGQRDPVTGLVVNGRPEGEGGDELLGLFLNTVPLRLDVEAGSWADLVYAAFAAESEVLPFRRFPAAELQRGLGGAVLYEAVFTTPISTSTAAGGRARDRGSRRALLGRRPTLR